MEVKIHFSNDKLGTDEGSQSSSDQTHTAAQHVPGWQIG